MFEPRRRFYKPWIYICETRRRLSLFVYIPLCFFCFYSLKFGYVSTKKLFFPPHKRKNRKGIRIMLNQYNVLFGLEAIRSEKRPSSLHQLEQRGVCCSTTRLIHCSYGRNCKESIGKIRVSLL